MVRAFLSGSALALSASRIPNINSNLALLLFLGGRKSGRLLSQRVVPLLLRLCLRPLLQENCPQDEFGAVAQMERGERSAHRLLTLEKRVRHPHKCHLHLNLQFPNSHLPVATRCDGGKLRRYIERLGYPPHVQSG